MAAWGGALSDSLDTHNSGLIGHTPIAPKSVP